MQFSLWSTSKRQAPETIQAKLIEFHQNRVLAKFHLAIHKTEIKSDENLVVLNHTACDTVYDLHSPSFRLIRDPVKMHTSRFKLIKSKSDLAAKKNQVQSETQS